MHVTHLDGRAKCACVLRPCELARLTANLGKGIIQQTPRGSELRQQLDRTGC